jgi:biotin-[acetyl-CoA-carboxylase] ligase BirA-like protein
MQFSMGELQQLRLTVGQIDSFCAHELRWVEEIASTSDELKKDWGLSSFRPVILVTEHQTAGRGQYERQWLDNNANCLLFSFSSETDAGGFPLSLLAGVALCLAIQEMCGAFPRGLWLKWPNDLWSGRAKLAGILTESCFWGDKLRVVTGIGINIRPLASDMLVSASVSDFSEAISHAGLLRAFLLAYDRACKLSPEKLRELWKGFAGRFWGSNFVVSEPEGEEYIASPSDLLVDGTLVLKKNDGSDKKVVSASLKPLF